MRTALVLLFATFALGPAALGHSGEYRVPIPPPRIDEDPDPRGGERVPTPGSRTGPATEGPEGTEPDPIPRPTSLPRPPRLGVGRDDDRLTLRIWWELNRHRYLPGPPDLPLRDELTDILIDSLDGGDSAFLQQALVALAKVGTPRCFGPIRGRVGSDDPLLHRASILALGHLGDDSASPLLKKIVADGEARLGDRVVATVALGLLGSKDNAAYLREVLDEDWQPSVRSAAALGLGLLRDEGSVEILGRVALGVHAVRSPETAPPDRPAVRVGLQCAAVQALGEILTPRAYDYLVAALAGGEPPVQGAAAISLSRAPGTIGLPVLGRALDAACPLQLRQYALLGLAERSDARADDAARAVLDSPHGRQGRMAPFAALAIGLGKFPEGTEYLLGVLRDPDGFGREARSAAALGVGLSGDREACAPLAKVLAKEKDPIVRAYGAIAAAMIGARDARTTAEELLVKSDLPEVRRHAATALRILAPPRSEEKLVTGLEYTYYVNREVALALARAAPARAAKELTDRLKAEGAEPRRFAAYTLGALLDRSSPARLRRLVSRMNVLCGAPVLRGLIYADNEYLYRLVGEF